MRIRCLKLMIVGATLASALLGAANASATGWNTNGPVSFTATTGALKWTDTSTGASWTCAGTTSPNKFIATLNAARNLMTGGGLATSAPTTPIIIECNDVSVSGVRFTMTCTATAVNGTSWTANGGANPNYFGWITSGNITGISCRLAVPNCATTITGTVNMTYTNPTATAAGRLTILVAGQALVLGNAGGATCTALRLNNADRVTLSDSAGANPVFTVTVPAALASQPRIWVV